MFLSPEDPGLQQALRCLEDDKSVKRARELRGPAPTNLCWIDGIGTLLAAAHGKGNPPETYQVGAMAAARAGTLRVIDVRTDMPVVEPAKVREDDLHLMVTLVDMDCWLTKIEAPYRVVRAESAVVVTAQTTLADSTGGHAAVPERNRETPIQREKAWMKMILDEIVTLGHKPHSLPPSPKGKRCPVLTGLRSALVTPKGLMTPAIFQKAWKELNRTEAVKRAKASR